MSSDRGTSLFSVIIMIGVLSISLTVTRILLFKQTDAQRELETRDEMKEIYGAMMGNRENGAHGYVGDMGRMPETLTELVDKTDQPDYVDTANSNNIKWGWNGPYVNAGREMESYKRDAWGNDYTIVGVNQIRSNGPDGRADTPDDIAFPSNPLNSVTGFLELKIPKGGALCSLSDINEVVVYSIDGEEGIERSKSLGTDFNLSDVEGEGFYVTDPIPLQHGIHAVKVSHSIQNENRSHSQTALINVPVFADSTHSQIAGTLPHTGIHLHPLYQRPPLVLDRIIDVGIVNATGCGVDEGVSEGVSYDVSSIDIVELSTEDDLKLAEISFDGEVVFTGITSISHDIENPTTITLTETYRLQPGMTPNKLVFLSAVTQNDSFLLVYHYTDTKEPNALRKSTLSFQAKEL